MWWQVQTLEGHFKEPTPTGGENVGNEYHRGRLGTFVRNFLPGLMGQRLPVWLVVLQDRVTTLGLTKLCLDLKDWDQK